MEKILEEKIQSLTPSQKLLFDTISSGRNVCCLGPGGTGKTYTLEAVIQYANENELNVVVCAFTGIAALNLHGMTIHRSFGAERGIIPRDSMKTSKLLEAADIIIIDEISMVRQDLFEYIIRSIHLAQKNSNKIDDVKIRRPFKQLVVCGDYGQLSPILTRAENEIYKKIYKSRYAFTSPLWDRQNFVYVVLKEQMRQTDKAFAAKLDRVRMGDVTVLKEFRQNDRGSETAVTLCTTNETADSINKRHLAALPGQHVYEADSFDGITDDEQPVPSKMTLAPGELVMFVNNDKEERWMNGSLATILACNDDCVEVRMHDGRIMAIRPVSWPICREEVKEGRALPSGKMEKHIERTKVGVYSQYPFRPAWAITVHKAQGQTYEEVNIAPGDFFDSGQLYVALSRCRTEEGLHIMGTLKESDLRFDSEVINFLEMVNKIAENK